MNSDLPQDFVKACCAGQLETAQRIFQNNPTHEFYYKFQLGFDKSCENGHLNVAQWLLTLENNMIDISIDQNYNFKWACGKGHLDVAQWLYERISQTLIDTEKNELCEEAFTYSCGNGHLDVAKWLFNMFNSPIHWIENDNYHDMLLFNCKHNNVEVAEWLCSLLPFKYSIDFSDSHVINCKINTTKNSKIITLIYMLTRSNHLNCLTANVVCELKNML